MTRTTTTESSLSRDPAVRAVAQALSAPFDPKDIKFKPQMVKNNRALVMAYIDARLIQDRLDDVIGVENWQDEYQILTDGSVMCRLRIKLGKRWITKTDVGSPSEQPDVGDRLKAAFSDALKRAAVKFGMGRYLYRLTAEWVNYDPATKKITQRPSLPAFAIPPAKDCTAEQPAAKMGSEEKAGPPAVVAPAPATPASNLPANGQELHRRLREYDTKLANLKLCAVGALLTHVMQAGVKAGYSANMAEWSGPAIPFAVDAVKAFDLSVRASKAEPRTAA